MGFRSRTVLAASAVVVCLLATHLFAVPAPPTNLSASVSGSTVVLTWTAPSGAAVTGYRLLAGRTPGASDVASAVIGPATQLTVTDVPGGIYFVRVLAIASDGESAASNEVAVTVRTPSGCAEAPGPPVLYVNAQGSLLTFSILPTTECGASSYVAHAGSSPGASDITIAAVGGVTHFSASAPDGFYYLRVYASNTFGTSIASNEVIVSVGRPPARPTTSTTTIPLIFVTTTSTTTTTTSRLTTTSTTTIRPTTTIGPTTVPTTTTALPGSGTIQPGRYRVGTDILPGRYFSEPSEGCQWARLRGFSGTIGELIANERIGFAADQWIIDILPSDAGFESTQECGPWFDTPPSAPPTGIPPGMWLVGTQVPAGTYRVNALAGCYWERLRSFSGARDAIIGNAFVSTASTQTVTIAATDVGFRADDECGTWLRIGSAADAAQPQSRVEVEANREESWRTGRDPRRR